MAAKKSEPPAELWAAGADPHTSAICKQVADCYRAIFRSVDRDPLDKLLESEWEKITLLVFDHCYDPRFELLLSVTFQYPQLPVIVVSPICSEGVVFTAIARGARTILPKPCHFETINGQFIRFWSLKWEAQGESKVEPPAQEVQRCKRCDRPLTAESGFNLQQAEKQLIRSALAHAKGDNLKAAELLGIGKSTLYRKLDIYGIRKMEHRVQVRDTIVVPSPS